MSPVPQPTSTRSAPGQSLSPNSVRDRLRIRVDLSQLASRQKLSTSTAGRKAPSTIDIKLGSTSFRFPYYKGKWQPGGSRRVYHSYTFVWHDGLRRRREKRSHFESLEARAREVALCLVNGETARLELSRADQASFLR